MSTWRYRGQNTFGSFLKHLRVSKGLSRHSLATASAIPDRRLETLELNNEPPSYKDIQALAAILETSESGLLEAAGYVSRERSANSAD